MEHDCCHVARLTRREALPSVAGVGVGIAGVLSAQRGLANPRVQPTASSAPSIPTWNTELRQLAPNVYAYIQGGGQGISNTSVSNAGLIVGPDDALAVDTLAAPIHTKAFIAAASKVTGGKPFGRVINTHHHGDHTNGNQYFLPAEIIGHEFCREEVLRGYERLEPGAVFQEREGWATGTEERTPAPPVTTVTDGMTYYYGDTVTELIFVSPAHTWGDLVVYLPQQRVLFAGDVTFNYVTPAAFQGHVTGWISAINCIMAMDVETIVPGHGPLHGKKELADLIEYYMTLKREAETRFNAGMSPGRAAFEIQTSHLAKFRNWNNPERVVADTVRLYAEFADTITPYGEFRPREATEEYLALLKP